MLSASTYILTLDQGTTSSRAMLVNEATQVLATAQQGITQYYPSPGWVEHDPDEILQSIQTVIKDVLQETGVLAQQITAIGITNQRETTVIWDRATGKAIAPAIVWQCRRTADQCQLLAQNKSVVASIRQKTGLLPDPYFSASKIQWLLTHIPGAKAKAQAGDLCFGTIDSWLLWHLTGGVVHATDMTNASRTLLFNIHQKCWDQDLLTLFDIPEKILPKVQASGAVFGHTCLTPLDTVAIPIAGIVGDQQAALFGQGCVQPQTVKNTYGTGCFLLMNTGEQAVLSEHGLLTTLVLDAYGQPVYGLEGAVFSGGSTIQWLRDELQLIKSAQETQTLAQQVTDNQGVYLVPAFTGLGAPYWDPYARGTLIGLTRGSNRCHIVRAALESIVYQTCDVLLAMLADTQSTLKALHVDGGACQNHFLLQFQADMLGCEVIRAKNIESSALGAAFLAGITTKYWKNTQQIFDLLKNNQKYFPSISDEYRTKLYQGWQKAVARSRAWIPSQHDH